jgi:hypothetical protein
MMATAETCGRARRNISSRLALNSACIGYVPVTLPPGHDKLAATERHGIAPRTPAHHDRDLFRRRRCTADSFAAVSQDNIDRHARQLHREPRQKSGIAVGQPEVEDNVVAFHPAEVA